MAETATQKKARLAKEADYIKSLENPITSQYDPRIGSNMGAAGTPGMTAGGPGSMTATSNLTDASIASGLKAATNLGIGEALLLDSIYGEELKRVFELYKTNKLAAADLLYKTKWAKLDTDVRDRYLLKLENSDLYKERLRSWLLGIKPKLKKDGLTLTDAQLEDYYKRGIDDLTIFDEALSGAKFEPGKTGGTQATDYNSLLSVATRNGISTSLLPKVLGFDTIDEVLKELQTGASIDDFSQKIRNYAKTSLPDWAKKLVDQGQDLTDIINPYRATISDELEIGYNSIDVTDKYIQEALAKNMSLYDLRKALRQDNRWQYTDKARENVSSSVLGVLRDFGFQG
jgi:hypothetical protein